MRASISRPQGNASANQCKFTVLSIFPYISVFEYYKHFYDSLLLCFCHSSIYLTNKMLCQSLEKHYVCFRLNLHSMFHQKYDHQKNENEIFLGIALQGNMKHTFCDVKESMACKYFVIS